MGDPDPIRSDSVPAPEGGGPCLVVHGGAWDIPDAYVREHEDGLAVAITEGRRCLEEGADAVDTATAVVAAMERHGAFDAGRGAVLTRKGTIELDAGIMDGESLAFGAVAAVRRLATPVEAARALMTRGAGMVRLLVGEEAERFAAFAGILPCDPGSLVHARERLRHVHLSTVAGYHTSQAFLEGGARIPSGTVGCVARDAEGRLAAATSTGGTPFRPQGRVGDSALPGCGYYADRAAAASSTGWGEAIASANLAGRAVNAVERGVEPERAARAELGRMASRIRNAAGMPAAGGIILVDAAGRGAWAYTTPRMARGGWRAGSDPWIAV